MRVFQVELLKIDIQIFHWNRFLFLYDIFWLCFHLSGSSKSLPSSSHTQNFILYIVHP